MSDNSKYLKVGLDEAAKFKWSLSLSPEEAIALVKRAEVAESERDNLRAILDSMAVKGMLEGETEVECLQRQLEQARKEKEKLESALLRHAAQMEELRRFRKMERMVYEFGEAKEQLESIVETLGAYIKAASDE